MHLTDMHPNPKGSLETRASLLSRLKNWEDADSWQDFANTYERLIYITAVRSGLSDSEAKDVLQEVLVCVAKKIDEFKSDPSRGTFKGWLLNLTRWRIADQLRKRPAKAPPAAGTRASDDTPTVERIPDGSVDVLAGIWESEWRQSVLEAAVARLRRRTKPKQFQMFELYGLRNWPGTKVAKELGVRLGQVYLVNHRLRKMLREEMTVLEQKMRE
ncbi:MAG TPA: sigma-70 family RNA polymerase sigma factor [Patescibacteria group bacterium]|nr:sigma-70 family RNA polymerase sigma factor [Patescibacteria group bacterium]